MLDQGYMGSPTGAQGGLFHPQSVSVPAMAHPALPSPTLTNPDMILPYREYEATPSSRSRPLQLPSPPSDWNSVDPVELDYSQGLRSERQTAPLTPSTPIIYGNGTMLSDIGEVTEAENVPVQRRFHTKTRAPQDFDGPLRSSPTMGYEAVMKRSKTGNHHRTVSAESASTVTTEGQAAEMHFEDFDDGLSVDDSNFQGDDEESTVDGYAHDTDSEHIIAMSKYGKAGVQDDTKSSAALSRRAELILANAKKRLDHMEGNLHRARSSLHITPSTSMSSIHSSSPLSRSTPSPPVHAKRIVSSLGNSPSTHRQLSANSGIDGSPGHARVYSENSLSNFPVRTGAQPRSASGPFALVSPTLTPQPQNPDYDTPDIIRPAVANPLSRSQSVLETLGEDELPSFHGTQFERSSTAEPYLYSTNDQRGLTRSNSSLQMRDLSHKMNDLKGRLSTLRDRAREENLRRRSLQSLRTPSPFTAAESWYKNSETYDEEGFGVEPGAETYTFSNESGNGDRDENHGQKFGRIDRQEHDIHIGSTASYFPIPEESHEVDHDEAKDSISASEYEESYTTAADGEAILENAINNDPHPEEYGDEFVDHNELEEYLDGDEKALDDNTTAIPLSHEDREDAFDYEHFFLHSAMGSMSRQRHRRESVSSEGSVETTRGPPASSNSNSRAVLGHLKNQKSVDSVSTMNTFMTANEEQSDDENDEDTLPAVLNRQLGTASSTGKRSTFGPQFDQFHFEDFVSNSVDESSRPSSAIRDRDPARPNLSQSNSISSLSTTSSRSSRSFPLVNKPKGHFTTRSLAPSDRIKADGHQRSSAAATSSPVAILPGEDQTLIERLVAGVGRCVLGLQDSTAGSSDERAWRRRLQDALSVLEGEDEIF